MTTENTIIFIFVDVIAMDVIWQTPLRSVDLIPMAIVYFWNCIRKQYDIEFVGPNNWSGGSISWSTASHARCIDISARNDFPRFASRTLNPTICANLQILFWRHLKELCVGYERHGSFWDTIHAYPRSNYTVSHTWSWLGSDFAVPSIDLDLLRSDKVHNDGNMFLVLVWNVAHHPQLSVEYRKSLQESILMRFRESRIPLEDVLSSKYKWIDRINILAGYLLRRNIDEATLDTLNVFRQRYSFKPLLRNANFMYFVCHVVLYATMYLTEPPSFHLNPETDVLLRVDFKYWEKQNHFDLLLEILMCCLYLGIPIHGIEWPNLFSKIMNKTDFDELQTVHLQIVLSHCVSMYTQICRQRMNILSELAFSGTSVVYQAFGKLSRDDMDSITLKHYGCYINDVPHAYFTIQNRSFKVPKGRPLLLFLVNGEFLISYGDNELTGQPQTYIYTNSETINLRSLNSGPGKVFCIGEWWTDEEFNGKTCCLGKVEDFVTHGLKFTVQNTVADGLCFYYCLYLANVTKSPRETVLQYILQAPAEDLQKMKRLTALGSDTSWGKTMLRLQSSKSTGVKCWADFTIQALCAYVFRRRIFILNASTMKWHSVHDAVDLVMKCKISWKSYEPIFLFRHEHGKLWDRISEQDENHFALLVINEEEPTISWDNYLKDCNGTSNHSIDLVNSKE